MNTILYDCLHYIQWIQNYETPREENSFNLESHFKELEFLFAKRDLEIQQFLCCQLPWHISVPKIDGKYVALMQDETLEIRSKKENYSHLIAHTTVPSDKYPQFRKLEWSPDCNLIVMATSDGLVNGFDVTGDNLFTVRVSSSTINRGSVLPNNALVSIMCLNARMKHSDWLYEIITISYGGELHCYQLCNNYNLKEHHVFTFGNDLSVSAAIYDPFHSLIIVAFPLINCKNPKYKNGLSAWRLLNDYPYYKLVTPTNDELLSYKCDKSLSARLFNRFYKTRKSVLVKLRISLEGQYLACLHTCGLISIWELPSLRLRKEWPLSEQLDVEIKEHYPADINWSPSQRLIIIRTDGSLSIYNVETMKNQLEILEFIDRRICITNLCDIDKGFLILSSETKPFHRTGSNNVSSIKETRNEQQMNGNQLQVLPETMSSKYSITSLLKLIWNFGNLHSPNKDISLVQRIYQLHCIKSIAPEDMFARKIDNKQYEDALEFAEKYNLDKNLVYQKQWINNPVSEESINNYLANVTDTSWILQQCCERLAESLPAAEYLLKYGLQLTEFETFIDLKNEQLTENLLLSSNLHSDLPVVRFTDEQLNILKMRTRLLLYYDRLCIYKKILDNRENVSYDKDAYQKFKVNNVIEVGILCAQQCNCVGVNLLLTHYGDQILPHYLQILDNIPETLPPSSYEYLLPKYDQRSGDVILPEQKQLREKDWSESGDLKRYIESVIENEEKLEETKLTRSNVFEWYQNRIRCIEEKSGIIDYSLELLEIASSYNVPNLEQLRNDLSILNQLVFDMNIDDISLATIEKMNNMEKLKLLMKKTTEETFVANFKSIAIPFMIKCNSMYAGSRSTLLKEYFQELTNSNNLHLVHSLIKEDSHVQEYEIFEDEREMVSLAMMCIYANRYQNQTENSLRMIEDIRDGMDWSLKVIPMDDELYQLECELKAALVLQNYEVEKPASFIHEEKHNADVAKNLLTEMAKFKVNRGSKSGNKDFKRLLDDMVWLQQDVFYVLSTEMCLQVFAFSLLTSNEIKHIQYSAVVLTLNPGDLLSEEDVVLPYDKSVTLILEAAKQYFNSAVTFYDNAISLAKACLNLIGEENPDIKEELELIRALEILQSFGVFILPFQVRSNAERFSIIKKCLNESLFAYKKTENLLQLAKCLQIFKDDENLRISTVLIEAAETAFNAEDHDACATICLELAKMGSSAQMAWKICKKLCSCDRYTDESIKRDLILFTLLNCPEDEILDVVKIRNQIEYNTVEQSMRDIVTTQFRQKNQNNAIPIDSYAHQEQSKSESLTSNSNSDFISGLVKNITSPSSEIITLNFWKTTLGWNDVPRYEHSTYCANDDFSKQAFTSYYGYLHEHCGCYVSPNACLIDTDQRLRFLLDLLKFYILSIQINGESIDNVRSRIDKVIFQCCNHLMANDCYQMFCFLLSLDDLKCSEECFKLVPNTLTCKKMALFYYGIKLGIRAQYITPKHIFLHSPTSLMQFISPLVDQFPNYPEVKLLTVYKEQVENFHDILQMQKLNCGIDVNRFYIDQDYRTDSILGLAMCVEKDKLQSAFKMAFKYDLPVDEVLLSCLTFLFLNNEHNVLLERLNDDWFEKLLKQSSASLSVKLKNSVYNLLDGCNHQSLTLFYSTLNIIDNNNVFHHLVARDHIKLLKKVKATSSFINYKLLTSEPPAILQSILPSVNPGNVSNIAKFVKSLPPELKNIISPKEIYNALIRKIFPIYENDSLLPLLQQSKLFECCCEYFQYMSKDDVIDFVYGAVFSNYSQNNRDLEMRKEFLNLSIESCRSVSFDFSKDLNRMFLRLEEYFNRLDQLYNSCEQFRLNEQLWRKLIYSVAEGSDYINKFLEEISSEKMISSDVQQRVRECLLSSEEFNFHIDHEIDDFTWE